MGIEADSIEILEQIINPAFLVKDGIITHTNHAAELRQIQKDSSVSDMILIGSEEYAAFTAGALCLCLNIEGAKYNATVVNGSEYHIFVLDSDFTEPELRAFALAAQYIREPLSNALSCTSSILSSNSHEDADQIKMLNRNLYRIHRTLCNMSDAAKYDMPRVTKAETRDIVSIIEEVLAKASVLLENSGHRLEFTGLQQSVNCLVDAEKITRAILNLISNAAKYAPKGSTIRVEFRRRNNKIYISVENDTDKSNGDIRGNLFNRFLRDPNIESGLNGIGLGMTIVRNAAMSHGGVLLLEEEKGQWVRVSFSITTQKAPDGMIHSPVLLPVDYTGGYDHALIELSDILDYNLYD